MRNKSIVAALVGSVVVLSACAPDPDMTMGKQHGGGSTVSFQDQNRIQVTRIGVFKDDLAYNDRRGVYIIVDTKTGKEFIGVSGVGIQEVGDHQFGKARAQDER